MHGMHRARSLPEATCTPLAECTRRTCTPATMLPALPSVSLLNADPSPILAPILAPMLAPILPTPSLALTALARALARGVPLLDCPSTGAGPRIAAGVAACIAASAGACTSRPWTE